MHRMQIPWKHGAKQSVFSRPGHRSLSVRRYSHLLVSRAEKRKQKIERLRAKWMQQKERYPDLGTRGLRQKFPAVYASLYRYDQDWLMAHQPPRKARPLVVNWDERDRALCRKLESAAGRMASLTPGRLARAAGLKGWISDYLSKLPRARQTLRRLTRGCRRGRVQATSAAWN